MSIKVSNEMFKARINRCFLESLEVFPNTPDLLFLESFNSHFLFVYGTLKKGFHNHGLLHNWRYVGKAFSYNPNFLMFKTPNTDKANGFPVVIHKETIKNHSANAFKNFSTRFGRIGGELYAYGNQEINGFRKLDMLEHNGKWYQRRIAPFILYKSSKDKLIYDPSVFYAWFYDGLIGEYEYVDNNKIKTILTPYPCYRGAGGVIYDWTS